MRKRQRLILCLSGALFLVCIIASAFSINHQLRQDRLDRALIRAVKELDAPAVDRLLAEGANANARDTGEPPLSLVGLVKRFTARIQHKPEKASTKHADSALELVMKDDRVVQRNNAARFDAIEAALIRRGADIHVLGLYGQGPLAVAARWGLHRTLDLLISRGVDVNARDEHGAVPLIDADAYSTKMLLQHGADVDAVDDKERTALFYATDVDTCRILIEHGAKLNTFDREELSVLYNVQYVQHANPAVIRLLEQHGAALNVTDKGRLLTHSR